MTEKTTNAGPKRGRPVSSAASQDITDAVIISETKRTEIHIPQTEEAPTPTITVEETKNEVPDAETIHQDTDGVSVDFMNDSNSDYVFAHKSEQYEAPPVVDNTDGWQSASYEAMGASAPDQATDPRHMVTAKDMEDIAEFAIELFDTGVSFVCAKVAEEPATNEFELPASKKRKLSQMLSIILEKRQMAVGMSIELMFVFTVLIMYIAPVKLAIQKRNDKRKNDEQSNEFTETPTSYAAEAAAAAAADYEPAAPAARRGRPPRAN